MTSKIRIGLSIVFVLLYCLLSCLPTSYLPVYASSIQVDGGYTSVLEDLSTDEGFDPDNYPIKEDDYSLQVIQIAESSDKELFVYVYQPCSPNKDLVATSIKISTKIGKDLNYKVYSLTLLNSVGCFYKYRVNDFIVSSDTTRYYDISAIHRKWNEKYDESLPEDNENTISEVPFVVGRQYTLTTTENGIDIQCQDIELITITDKYVGFVRYFGEGGFLESWKYKDSHFVAFKTDKKIERLMEADIFFQTQYKQTSRFAGVNTYHFGGIEDKYAYLSYDDKEVIYEDGELFWKHKYTWKRIQTAKEFINGEDLKNIYSGVLFNQGEQSNLTAEGITDVVNMDWVLRFYESDYIEYEHTVSGTPSLVDSTLVSNVSILRLAFETDGVYYNLGVVDNFQTGDRNPDNNPMGVLDMFKIILMLLLIVVLVAILGPFLPTVISFLIWIIKIALKIVFWIISLPFKIFSKSKKRY